jgi:hypothetical protein
MKMLLDIIGPEVENGHGHEATLESEIAAYVKALVKSRTRGPEPRVAVVCLGPNDVCVNADELLRLQSKATALGWIEEKASEKNEAVSLLADIVLGDPNSVEDDKKMFRAIERAKKILAKNGTH